MDAVVDEGGNLVKQFTYDVFGAVRETLVGSGAETVGFSGGIGHITDLENSLVYMRARYYEPSLGRFISQDPGCNGTNWYVYCRNNPVNMVDPTGQAPWDLLGAYMLDTAVGGMLILLGAYLVRNTELSALGYVLGISGLGLVLVGVVLTLTALVGWLGPILTDYIDGLGNNMWRRLEQQSQEQASSLTADVVSLAWAEQISLALCMLDDE